MGSHLEPLLPQGQVQAGGEEAPRRENWVPFRLCNLRNILMRDFKDSAFAAPGSKEKFVQFCKYLSSRNALRLLIAYTHMKDLYAFLDPDNDEEKPGTLDEISSDDREAYEERTQSAFELEFLSVLDKGSFQAITQADLNGAKVDMGRSGMHSTDADPNILHTQLWTRGEQDKEETFRSWRTLWRTKTERTKEYDRLLVITRLHPRQALDAYFARLDSTWWRRLFRLKTRLTEGNAAAIQPGQVYLKLYKDVDRRDVDMLMPGSQPRFSWYDWLSIWVPICIGIFSAVYQLVWGDEILLDTWLNITISLSCIAAPITWGVQGWYDIQDKKEAYQARLNELYLSHIMDANAGVMLSLLDEAQEQEDVEAMLAYFFLWRGQDKPPVMRKKELDAAVENYLRAAILRAFATEVVNVQTLDFDVDDAVHKLANLNILKRARLGVGATMAGKGDELLQVPNLDEALESAHVRNFDEDREVEGAHTEGALYKNQLTRLAQPSGVTQAAGGGAAGQGQAMHTSQGAAPFVAVTVGAGNDGPKRRAA